MSTGWVVVILLTADNLMSPIFQLDGKEVTISHCCHVLGACTYTNLSDVKDSFHTYLN